MAAEKNYILSQQVAEKKLRRMALEIIENNLDEQHIILAGIRENGAVVATCLQKILSEITSLSTELLTISLDKKEPGEVILSKKIDFNNKVTLLIS